VAETTDTPLAAPRAWKPTKSPFRTRVTAGLVLIIPLAITFWVVRFIFSILRDASLWVIEALLKSPAARPVLEGWGLVAEDIAAHGIGGLPTMLQWTLACLAVVLTLGLLYFLGGITTNVVGRQAWRLVEAAVGRVPVVKTVYSASKKVLEGFTSETGQAFQRVVLIPFMGGLPRTVGFVTGETRDAVTGEALYTVFIATTPNPTTGFVFVVRRADVIELDWTIEEAVQMVMSAGVVLPRPVSLAPTELQRTAGRTKHIA
jgi:uncharacterized membrane protein